MRWSPDGKAIDYVETRDGVGNIWRLSVDGAGEPRKLTDWKDALIFRFAWSPDGKRLVCARGTHGNDLVLLEDLDFSQ
jgi:Tol biopolymer transport system component